MKADTRTQKALGCQDPECTESYELKKKGIILCVKDFKLPPQISILFFYLSYRMPILMEYVTI